MTIVMLNIHIYIDSTYVDSFAPGTPTGQVKH